MIKNYIKLIALSITIGIAHLASAQLTITTYVCGDVGGSTVRLTGPFWGWDPNGGPVAADNGDGTYTFTLNPAPSADMEYLLILNGVQENLIADMVNGGTCAPVTDYANYANRIWLTTDPTTLTNAYGQCDGCYDTGDTTAIKAIATANFSGTTTLNWETEPNPGNWDGVIWDNSTPSRVEGLNLNENHTGGGNRRQFYTRTGLVTDLVGELDLTGLDQLKFLEYKRNVNLTEVNVSGLTNLVQVSGTRSGVQYLNCESNSNLLVVLHKNTPLDSLNLNGCTSLGRVIIRDNTNISSINITGLSNINGAPANPYGIDDVKGGFGVRNNNLTFETLTQIFNLPNSKKRVDNSSRYSNPPSITVGQNIDYTAEAVVNVNGTNVNTVFNLLSASGTILESNSTGIFTMNYAGNYTVQMQNSGYILTTGVITVTGGGACSGPFNTTDSLALINLASANFTANTNLNWEIEACPGNWDGVTWDFSSPRRVIGLDLSQNTSSQGSSSNNGSSCSDADGTMSFSINNHTWIDHGVDTELKGTVDVTSLSELKVLLLNNNDSVTDLNVSGLANLERLFVPNTSIENLDASNLPSLLQLKAKMNNIGNGNTRLQSIDASNCPNLVLVVACWNMDSLRSINVNGCTNLEKIAIKQAPELNDIQMSGVTKLRKLTIGDGGDDGIDGPTGGGVFPSQVYANTDLIILGWNGQLATGNVDLSVFPNLRKACLKQNKLSSITPTDSTLQFLNTIKGYENRMTLTNAVELDNNTAAGTNQNDNYDQMNDGATILYTDSLDYSIHDSININGTMTASTFRLYRHGTGLESTNSTGIFNFVLADTINTFNVEMENDGIIVTTDTIYILPAAAGITTTISSQDFGSVEVGSTSTRIITVENTGTADLNVTGFTLPTTYTISPSTATIASGSTSNFTVTFTPADTLTYAGTITVLNDAMLSGGTNTVNVTGLGIVTPDTMSITATVVSLEMYPNPTKGLISIESNELKYSTLNIFTVQGTLVKAVAIRNNTIDIRDLDNGIYFFRSEDGLLNEKVIKQ